MLLLLRSWIVPLLLLSSATSANEGHGGDTSGSSSPLLVRQLDGMTQEELDAENPNIFEPPTGGSTGLDETNEVFARAVEAVGGAAALLSLDYLEMEMTGMAFGAFASTTPNAIANASSFERSIQMQGPADNMVISESITPLYRFFPFLFQAQDIRRVVNGDEGFMFGDYVLTDSGTLPSAVVAAMKRQQYLFNPHYILRNVLLAQEDEDAPFSLLSPHPTLSWFYVRDEVSPALAVQTDPDTGFIQSVTVGESNALIRNVQVQVRYDDWTLVASESGLVFPSSVKMTIRSDDPLLLWEEVRDSVATPMNFDNTIFDLPPEFEDDVFDETGYDFGLQSQHLQNQWFATGLGEYPNNPSSLGPVALLEDVLYVVPNVETVQSVVIGYGNNEAILIEAAASAIHGANLVDIVEQVLPGSTLTHVIQSHPNVDHASGLREVVALSEAEVYVGDQLAPFYLLDVFGAQSTLVPDSWSELRLRAQDVTITEVGSNTDIVLVVNQEDLVVYVNYPIDFFNGTNGLITFIDTRDAVYVYVADVNSIGLGTTNYYAWVPSMVAYLRSTGVIEEDCTSDVPLFFIPAHGPIVSLEAVLVENFIITNVASGEETTITVCSP